MPISFACSHCGKQFQVGDELAGKRAKCVCGQAVTVPAAPAPSAPIPMGIPVEDPGAASPVTPGAPQAPPSGAPPSAPVPMGILVEDTGTASPMTPGSPQAAPTAAGPTPVTPSPLGPTYPGGYSRPFRWGQVSDKDLVGSFMAFLGWAPPAALVGYLCWAVYALCTEVPARIVFFMFYAGWLPGLQLFISGVVAGFTSWFYVFGGIGTVQGKREGIRKGITACYLSFALLGINLMFIFIRAVQFASEYGGDSFLGIVFEVMWKAFLRALLAAIVPGLVLAWCLTRGSTVRRR